MSLAFRHALPGLLVLLYLAACTQLTKEAGVHLPMSHYLLKWNPTNWSRARFLESYYAYLAGEELNWSCGGTKRIVAGDRVFLLKTGQEPRGIIGDGFVTKPPELGDHYNDDLAASGKTALYIRVRFNHLFLPEDDVPIARVELDRPELTSTVWNAQGSGKQIPPGIADALEELWASRTRAIPGEAPDEVRPRPGGYPEGAVRPVLVNAYERNPEARAECIRHWGLRCRVCGFDFEKVYGDRGKGFVVVHHIKPISHVGQVYQVDPVRDLIPVCANCHAMIHRTIDAMSIAELKQLLRSCADDEH